MIDVVEKVSAILICFLLFIDTFSQVLIMYFVMNGHSFFTGLIEVTSKYCVDFKAMVLTCVSWKPDIRFPILAGIEASPKFKALTKANFCFVPSHLKKVHSKTHFKL